MGRLIIRHFDFYKSEKVSRRRILTPNLLALRASALSSVIFGSALEVGILFLAIRSNLPPITTLFMHKTAIGLNQFFIEHLLLSGDSYRQYERVKFLSYV